MEEFVLRFQTFEGITEIIKSSTAEEIIDKVSVLSGISGSALTGLQVLSPGSDLGKRGYALLIKELKKTIPFFVELYQKLPEDSKKTLTSVFKYWIIPDMAFLREAFSTLPEDHEDPGIILKDLGEVKDHIEEIRELTEGEALRCDIGDCLRDLYLNFKLLSAIRDDMEFRFYLADENRVFLTAKAPLSKMEKLRRKKKTLRVVSLAKDPGAWRNEELLKDKGLVPYLFYRDQGCRSVMVGVDNGSYPYLEEYLQGMEMEFLPDASEEEKRKWISEHAKETDILILNGLYPINMDILKIYRDNNPEGIVYLPLDANSAWMDRMLHTDEGFMELMDKVDLIGSSGRRMQRHLNKKWPWNVEFFPNGYYHPWVKLDHPEYTEKENVILTVGRLGTEQKATDVMLEAFALAAPHIPDWSLKLVGGIEPYFQSCIHEFFEKHPELKDRVIFAGKIVEKEALFWEYRKAKIFTLTSILEGGTPNVVAEALHSGCAMAVTEFDASSDATADGKCGISAAIGDIKGMSDAYISLCSDEAGLKEMCEYAFFYSEKYFSMEKVSARIFESLEECL